MAIECVCEECDEIFVSSEYRELCPRCKKKTYKKKPVFMSYNKEGNELAECLFDIVIEKSNKGGTTGHHLSKELKNRFGIKRNLSGSAVSVMDRAGYLVFIDDGKIYPYKNMHTGEEYEIEIKNKRHKR